MFNLCLSVCFPHDISKPITKLDKGMFHLKFWKSLYFEVKGSKVKVTSH